MCPRESAHRLVRVASSSVNDVVVIGIPQLKLVFEHFFFCVCSLVCTSYFSWLQENYYGLFFHSKLVLVACAVKENSRNTRPGEKRANFQSFQWKNLIEPKERDEKQRKKRRWNCREKNVIFYQILGKFMIVCHNGSVGLWKGDDVKMRFDNSAWDVKRIVEIFVVFEWI